MTNWFERLTVECQLEASAAHALQEDGFVVIEGPVPRPAFDQLVTTYDRVMDEATEPDKRVGRQNTRVHDLVNRAGAFDGLYLYPPVLAACCQVIRQPFKLSNVLGRTLHPQSEAEQLHVDTAGDQKGWPMLGFILMIDEFATVNGATRFVPGSHRRPMSASEEPLESEVVPACGPHRARWLSTTGRSCTATGRIARIERGGPFKGLSFAATVRDSAWPTECPPKRGSVSDRWRST